ncbi:hypothetical protein T02_545 [Trichinella nativa]|uniref:Uncharacterized protein n=1 Tax=Trichinella nativa TaxID=6335 RepID=A0A0V1KZ43_9BILA|nr:hypothetical protein T02_545 [Trichinella nativa]
MTSPSLIIAAFHFPASTAIGGAENLTNHNSDGEKAKIMATLLEKSRSKKRGCKSTNLDIPFIHHSSCNYSLNASARLGNLNLTKSSQPEEPGCKSVQ